MKLSRHFVAAVILSSSLILIYALPKKSGNRTDILSKLYIPKSARDWQGVDMGSKLDAKELRYNSINKILARSYTNSQNKQLLLLVLDSANFHNPKTCFGALGYDVKDLERIKFSSPREFGANALYFHKGRLGRLVIYWMCIDKKQVGWLGQKVKELGFSMLNKNRTGVMVRLDLPTKDADLQSSILLAQNFIDAMGTRITPDDAEYIFGK